MKSSPTPSSNAIADPAARVLSSQSSIKGSNREIAWFYSIALGLAGLAMLLLWHLPEGFQRGDLHAAMAAYGDMSLIYGSGPALAALLVTGIFRGWPGIKSLASRVIVWRVSPLWYVAALVIPVVPQWIALAVWSRVTGAPLEFPGTGAFLSA
jgi:hypothetical protein